MTPANEEARRYLRIADRDIKAFIALLDISDVSYIIKYFLAQQAVEKCLKAVLFVNGIEFRRIHDLEELSQLLLRHDVSLPLEIEKLRKLNPFAVTFRYDDEEIPAINQAEVKEMVETLRLWAGERVE